MESNQVPGGGNQPITVATFASKFRSKTEVYAFLTLDVKSYLPPPHTLTMFFLKDLVSGQKKRKLQPKFLTNSQTSKCHMSFMCAFQPMRT